jgi:hypothetical protein
MELTEVCIWLEVTIHHSKYLKPSFKSTNLYAECVGKLIFLRKSKYQTELLVDILAF